MSTSLKQHIKSDKLRFSSSSIIPFSAIRENGTIELQKKARFTNSFQRFEKKHYLSPGKRTPKVEGNCKKKTKYTSL